MGFFQDLKEDLSQAVNELMDDDSTEKVSADSENEEVVTDEEIVDDTMKSDETEIVQLQEDTDFEKTFSETEDIEMEEDSVEDLLKELDLLKEEKGEKGYKTMDEARALGHDEVIDETAIITKGMTISGDVNSQGSLDVIGGVIGNINILGKLNVTGNIQGNSKAAEVYADSAKITGEIVSTGNVKIGPSSVIIGNIVATCAVIAGAVKGDIDVHGPVVLDTSAIVMGNIKSKSVQINNGAVIEGLCSQCYADVSPTSFFEEFKK